VSDPDNVLADSFAAVARVLQAEVDPQRTQERITAIATKVINGCDHAAISVVKRRGVITTVAPTDETPGQVDAIQYQTREGPCLDAIAEHEVFHTDDLDQERRWPAFSPRAVAETGVRSMLSFRLFVQDDTIGALNLYSRTPSAFDVHARAVGAVLAAHAAIALDAAREKEHGQDLEQALLTSRRIGVAMGVLMGRGNLTEDQAFAQLSEASQHLNVKVRDLAQQVIDTGQLPTLSRPTP
jgi:GAF domain-containing protein